MSTQTPDLPHTAAPANGSVRVAGALPRGGTRTRIRFDHLIMGGAVLSLLVLILLPLFENCLLQQLALKNLSLKNLFLQLPDLLLERLQPVFLLLNLFFFVLPLSKLVEIDL